MKLEMSHRQIALAFCITEQWWAESIVQSAQLGTFCCVMYAASPS